MSWTEYRHASADTLATAVGKRVFKAIDGALRARGKAVVAIAGGRTTPPVLRRLAAERCDWSRLTILPTDERWVAADHVDCNLHQLQESFIGIDGVHWIALAPTQPRGKASATFANKALETVDAAFDLCLLGMGADGHFASLFPGADNLSEALDPATFDAAIAIVPDPMPSAGSNPRVSLTLARLLHSRQIILAVTGADKRATLDRALVENDPLNLPVAALLRAPGRTVEIHWSP